MNSESNDSSSYKTQREHYKIPQDTLLKIIEPIAPNNSKGDFGKEDSDLEAEKFPEFVVESFDRRRFRMGEKHMKEFFPRHLANFYEGKYLRSVQQIKQLKGRLKSA